MDQVSKGQRGGRTLVERHTTELVITGVSEGCYMSREMVEPHCRDTKDRTNQKTGRLLV